MPHFVRQFVTRVPRRKRLRDLGQNHTTYVFSEFTDAIAFLRSPKSFFRKFAEQSIFSAVNLIISAFTLFRRVVEQCGTLETLILGNFPFDRLTHRIEGYVSRPRKDQGKGRQRR